MFLNLNGCSKPKMLLQIIVCNYISSSLMRHPLFNVVKTKKVSCERIQVTRIFWIYLMFAWSRPRVICFLVHSICKTYVYKLYLYSFLSPREKCLPTGAPNSNFELRVSCETEMRKHHQLSFTTNITELIKPNELNFLKMHDAHKDQLT